MQESVRPFMLPDSRIGLMWISRLYAPTWIVREARSSSRSASGLSSDAGYGSRSWPGYFADRGLWMGFSVLRHFTFLIYHTHSKHNGTRQLGFLLLGFFWHFLFRNETLDSVSRGFLVDKLLIGLIFIGRHFATCFHFPLHNRAPFRWIILWITLGHMGFNVGFICGFRFALLGSLTICDTVGSSVRFPLDHSSGYPYSYWVSILIYLVGFGLPHWALLYLTILDTCGSSVLFLRFLGALWAFCGYLDSLFGRSFSGLGVFPVCLHVSVALFMLGFIRFCHHLVLVQSCLFGSRVVGNTFVKFVIVVRSSGIASFTWAFPLFVVRFTLWHFLRLLLSCA